MAYAKKGPYAPVPPIELGKPRLSVVALQKDWRVCRGARENVRSDGESAQVRKIPAARELVAHQPGGG